MTKSLYLPLAIIPWSGVARTPRDLQLAAREEGGWARLAGARYRPPAAIIRPPSGRPRLVNRRRRGKDGGQRSGPPSPSCCAAAVRGASSARRIGDVCPAGGRRPGRAGRRPPRVEQAGPRARGGQTCGFRCASGAGPGVPGDRSRSFGASEAAATIAATIAEVHNTLAGRPGV